MIVDEFTKFIDVKLITRKNEMQDHIKDFVMCMKALGHNVKQLRTDSAAEFVKDTDEGKDKQTMEIMKLTEKSRRFYCVALNMNSANSIHSQKKASRFENACIEFSNLEISATFLFC